MTSAQRVNLKTFDSKTGVTYFVNPFGSWSDTNREATVAPLGGNLFARAATVYIDVNGKQAPNTAGRDIFQFKVYVQICTPRCIFLLSNYNQNVSRI